MRKTISYMMNSSWRADDKLFMFAQGVSSCINSTDRIELDGDWTECDSDAHLIGAQSGRIRNNSGGGKGSQLKKDARSNKGRGD